MSKLLEKTRETMPSIHSLPESWYKARGLLSKKKASAMLKHVKKLRAEWDL